MDVDVAVVGGGLSGLTAARELHLAGVSVRVSEARDRVGGRTWTRPYGEDTWMDAGGQWVGPTQTRILALLSEFGLDTFPTYDEGQHLVEIHGRRRRYRGRIPPLNPIALAEIGAAQLRLERLAEKVPTDEPWRAPGAPALDAQTFATWIDRLRTSTAREYYRLVSDAVLATDAATVSLLHVLFYVASAGGLDPLTETQNGAQQDRVVGGTQQVSERLAASLGDRVTCGRPVTRIQQDDAGVTVHAGGDAVRARRVIVAVPPPMAARIAQDPPLPARTAQLLQRLPVGAVIKCHAVYPEPFWRADGFSGQAVSTRPPVSFAFDNTPPEGRPGMLVAFVEGSRAVRLGQAGDEVIRRTVLTSLARLFGTRAGDPDDFVAVDWAAEPWTRGCYGAHAPPGVWTTYGAALREPVGRLHWAGTETATLWSGYMDGAVGAGLRAAREVLGRL